MFSAIDMLAWSSRPKVAGYHTLQVEMQRRRLPKNSARNVIKQPHRAVGGESGKWPFYLPPYAQQSRLLPVSIPFTTVGLNENKTSLQTKPVNILHRTSALVSRDTAGRVQE